MKKCTEKTGIFLRAVMGGLIITAVEFVSGHNQYNIRAWSMGLFPSAVQSPRSSLSSIYRSMDVSMHSCNLSLRNASKIFLKLLYFSLENKNEDDEKSSVKDNVNL